MINIAELLKDAPKDMKLYSPLFGEVKFVGINKQSSFPIAVIDCEGNGKSFTEFGVYFAGHPDSECLLFPSKECRTWENFELPVQHKFKVGDWLVYKYGNCFAGGFRESQVVKVKDGVYYFSTGTTGSCKFIEESCRLWSIADAKDGDIIGFNDCTHNDGSYIDWVGIYKHQSNDFANHHHSFHCVITSANTFRIGYLWRVFTAYPATKEQRDLLFKKMKEAGYQWDAEKKELRKIKPHYDISNFKPFDKVLVKDSSCEKWVASLFSNYDKDSIPHHFVCIDSCYVQCIPFEGNKHLLGTTDPCDGQYINW